MMTVIFVALLVFNWILYHKVFTVFYFGSIGQSIIKELVGAAIVAMIEIAIIIFVGKWVLIIIAIIGVVILIIYLIYKIVNSCKKIKKVNNVESSESSKKEKKDSEINNTSIVLENNIFSNAESKHNNTTVSDKEKCVVKEAEPRESMVYCTYCGKKIIQSSKFCTFCGEKNNYR